MVQTRPFGGRPALAAFCVFAAIGLAITWPALDGPFISDDLLYLVGNPYVREPSPAHLLEILDPSGAATVAVVNWAPVHLLLHAAEWRLFGEEPRGYHVVNALVHALAATLFACLLARSGLSTGGAMLGAALFLVHPANVEAVAWISQLKTGASLALTLGALLLWPRRPWLASPAFALALLTKATAAVALPVAVLTDRLRRGRPRWAWVLLWTAILAGYALAELWTHNRTGAAAPLATEALARVRTTVAIAGRYLVIGATSWGVSALHEPPAAASWLDPWWLGSAAALALLAWRALVTWRRGQEESIYWTWAAASFLPVSQLFPFLYPMADRYLYFMLPGLIGAGLLAFESGFPALRERGALRSTAAVAFLALVLAFAVRAHLRAPVYTSEAALAEDATRHYPDGRAAHFHAAWLAARAGDREGALRELRTAIDRGFNRYRPLLEIPEFRPLYDDPRFGAMVVELTGWWIDWGEGLERPTQAELRTVALAYLARGDLAAAETYLVRAQHARGPLGPLIAEELARVRRARGR